MNVHAIEFHTKPKKVQVRYGHILELGEYRVGHMHFIVGWMTMSQELLFKYVSLTEWAYSTGTGVIPPIEWTHELRSTILTFVCPD